MINIKNLFKKVLLIISAYAIITINFANPAYASIQGNKDIDENWFKKSPEYQEFIKDKQYEESYNETIYVKVEEDLVNDEKQTKITQVSKDQFGINEIINQNKNSLSKSNLLQESSWSSLKTTTYVQYNLSVNKFGDKYDASSSFYWIGAPGAPRPGYVGDDILALMYGRNFSIQSDSAKFLWENDVNLNGVRTTNHGYLPVRYQPGGIYADTELGSRTHKGLKFYGANERGLLYCTLEKNNSSALSENIFVDYAMQMKTIIFGSPSFSIPSGASLTISHEKYFQKLVDNPNVLVRF